ncbi:MAG: uroporphyrinogen-III synthase [Myxococcota bacterium]|jgi:uroporphyrinogen-III synthase
MVRVLITRAVASPMDSLLTAGGAQPVHVPLLSLRTTGAAPPGGRPDLVLVTSSATAAAVPNLAEILSGAPVVSVGGKTAASLRQIGVTVTATGSAGGASAVVEVTRRVVAQGIEQVWVIGARTLSPQLSAALDEAPWTPIRWSVYDNHPPDGVGEALSAALPVDVITFASGSAARTFAQHARPGGARVVVIGPSTAQDARRAGLPVHAVAATPTMEALVAVALASVGG